MEGHRNHATNSDSVENTPSLALLKKVGFVTEGVLRQHTLRDGRWDDSVIMGIIRDDLGRE
jgi:RimJ/RimL family protein N-acetyltransferase